MGSNDTPPPHVPSSYKAVSTVLLGCGGLGYTLAYILMTRQSIRDRTYAMPLFSLAFNFGWEIIFSLYVAESLPEKITFWIWMILDLGLIYSVLKFGANEWKHAPIVGRNIGKILTILVSWSCAIFWAVSHWWLRENINPKPGKHYGGVEGPDTTELGWWTSLTAQVVLSVMLLAQILVRGNSGGASYGIWLIRFLGSVAGLVAYYGYCWYVWPEAHRYFVNPVAVVMSGTWVTADLAYFVVLRRVKRTEVVLSDWRKVRGGSLEGRKTQ
jgi:hypothetical protein